MLDSSRSGWEYEGDDRFLKQPEDEEAAAGSEVPVMSPGGIRVTADPWARLPTGDEPL